MAPTWREERQFGWVVGGVFTVLGGWTTWRETWPVAGPILLTVGLPLVLLAFLAPPFLARPRRYWMALAEALSFVSTRVILGVVFLLLVTPIGLLGRLVGRDPLGRRSADTGTRWQPYPARQHDPRHFEKMY